MNDCVFCKIVAGDLPAHKAWEDEEHVAFLSPWGNTEGFTVVATKKHYPSYAFDLPDDVLAKLTLATKRVAKMIDKALSDVGRCGMFYEGFGVDHVHSKLFPMHGTADMSSWQPIEKKATQFFKQYPGYLSSHDVPDRQPEERLAAVAKMIREADI